MLRSDLFETIGDHRYDVIVSNPLYVSTAELATLPEEYRKEPQLGLAGGATGLDLILRILMRRPDISRSRWYSGHRGRQHGFGAGATLPGAAVLVDRIRAGWRGCVSDVT